MRSPRPLRRFAACTAVSAAVAGLSLPTAFADTTPAPVPEDPNQPPYSGAPPVPPPGPIVAEVGTGIGMLRVLPGTVPPNTIMNGPSYGERLPKQSLTELGLGLARVKADSETQLAHERSVAEASPFGVAVGGNAPQVPGLSANQTAVPDHPEPTTSSLAPPASPADALLKLNGPRGSAHARWDQQLGPCVQPISEATTSLAGVSALNELPGLPETPEQVSRLLPVGKAAPGLDEARTGMLRAKLSESADRSPARLGGLLSGGAPTASGAGSLVHVPDAVQAHSRIELVDNPGGGGKAVRSTSELQLSSVRLLAGTAQELRVDVVSKPRLIVTATGDPTTSTVEYAAPVLRVSQGGRELAVLDAAHPQADLPIGAPPGAAPRLPVVGGGVPHALDLGVLRLGLGELTKQARGTELKAGARLFDLKVLPGAALGMPDAALAEVSFGEQTARAGAPVGGVVCDVQHAPAAPPAEGSAGPPLAETSGAYHTIPLFWTGTGLLLVGAVLVAAVPRRQR